MITVYDGDSHFEEETRSPEGYFCSYKGYKTHIHWLEIEGVYHGQIENIKETVDFKKAPGGLSGQMLELSMSNEFVRAVDAYLRNQKEG